MAFALFTTAVIFNVAAIANNNLQDLKTGQLVDATPWKQQVALMIGVVAGAFVIPPVLDLVNHAYGFVGAPGAELRPNPLPAPQAGLISSLAQGVIAGDIDWSLIRIGAIDRSRASSCWMKFSPERRNTCAFRHWRSVSEFICRRKAR